MDVPCEQSMARLVARDALEDGARARRPCRPRLNLGNDRAERFVDAALDGVLDRDSFERALGMLRNACRIDLGPPTSRERGHHPCVDDLVTHGATSTTGESWRGSVDAKLPGEALE